MCVRVCVRERERERKGHKAILLKYTILYYTYYSILTVSYTHLDVYKRQVTVGRLLIILSDLPSIHKMSLDDKYDIISSILPPVLKRNTQD